RPLRIARRRDREDREGGERLGQNAALPALLVAREPRAGKVADLTDLGVALAVVIGVVHLAVFGIGHSGEVEATRGHPGLQILTGAGPLIKADRLAREVGEAFYGRVFDHRRGRDEHDRRAQNGPAREALIENLRAVQEGEIVLAFADTVEGRVEIVRVERDASVRLEQRRADGAAEVEIEPQSLAPVGRLADEARPGHAAAADDAIGLDAIDDGPGVGDSRSKRQSENQAEQGLPESSSHHGGSLYSLLQRLFPAQL